jgi:GTPase
LHPQLGVVALDEKSFVIADIPGLIEGAHEGAGLGTRFLGHVERCAVLLHMIDVTADDPVASYRTVRKELKAYSKVLADKPEIIAFNKVDAIDEKELEKKLKAFTSKIKSTPLAISAAGQKNIQPLLRAMLKVINKSRGVRLEPDPDHISTEDWKP